MVLIQTTIDNRACPAQHPYHFHYMTDGMTKDSTGRIHAVYTYRDGANNDQICCKYSDDGGATWAGLTQLTADATSNPSQQYPAICARPNNDLMVVWSGKSAASPATFQIRYCYFTFGVGWGAVIDLTAAAVGDHQYSGGGRSLALQGTDIHLVYYGKSELGVPFSAFDVKHRVYTVGWSGITYIEVGAIGHDALYPAIAVDGSGDLQVVYSYDNNMCYKKRTGGIWGLTEPVMVDIQGQYLPDIEIETTGLARVVWVGFVGAGANYQIRYKDRSAVGVWSAVKDVTADAYDHWPATIARDLAGDVHVLWGARYAGSPLNVQLGYIKYSAGAWGAISYLTAGVDENGNPYAMGGYEGNVNSSTGFKVQYHANAPEDALFYGDYNDNYVGPLTLTAFVHPTGQAGYSPPPPPIVRETGEM